MAKQMVEFMRSLKAGQEVVLDLGKNSLYSPGRHVAIAEYQFRQRIRHGWTGLSTANWWAVDEFSNFLEAGFAIRLKWKGLRIPDGSLLSGTAIQDRLSDSKCQPGSHDSRVLVYEVVSVI